MKRRSNRLIAVLGCLLQLICSGAGISENLDTLQPILRSSPTGEETTNGYFGYSLVLHQREEVAQGEMSRAVEQTRIIVSAPRATIPASPLENTGAIYDCPVEPGTCGGLMGDNTGADQRLYDIAGNTVAGENKTGQFLGGSMFSLDDAFVACAHRYVRTRFPESNNPINTFISPIGRCFYTTDRSLRNFVTVDPCPLSGDEFSTGSGGICQAGTSSVITRSGNSYTLGLGAPGYFRWRGSLIRRSPDGSLRRPNFGQGTDLNEYMGYAVTSGFFLTTNREDYAVSVPKRFDYVGSVNIITNTNNLVVASPTALTGEQLGAYYGFSLLSANLNGDGFSELLVGAPMYSISDSQPETGRVYVYINENGNLRLFRRIDIDGIEPYSRFGYAMANMGDINGDGRDDIAISAPFTDSRDGMGSGTVYIFHSSTQQTLTMQPQQVIVGSSLSFSGANVDLSTLRGFGSALASGVDVDANGYNDLAIGSFMAQRVFLLRTRPLANAQISLMAAPRLINLDNTACMVGGTPVSCFTIMACIEYDGVGVSDTLNLQFTIDVDVNSVERRLRFQENDANSLTLAVDASRNSEVCRSRVVYVQNGIVDRLSPFVSSLSVEAVGVTITPGNGNEQLTDFSSNPIISITGPTTLQVETFRNCTGPNGECVPDLRLAILRHTENRVNGQSVPGSQEITLGRTRSVVIETDIDNLGEDSFQTTLTVSVPVRTLVVGRVYGRINNGNERTFACPQMRDDDGMTLVTCDIGNPLRGRADLRLFITIMPGSLVGNEMDIDIGLALNSINPGVTDPTATGQVTVRAEANALIDPIGLVNPELVTYPSVASDEVIANASQLGPPVVVSFVVRNSGPSTIGTISLTVNWPLRATDSGENYVIYPALVSTGGTSATVTCENMNINPANLDLGDVELEGGEGDEGTGTSGKKKRRRRRSAVHVPKVKRRKRLAKRQDVTNDANGDVVDFSENRNFSCGDQDTILTCVPIQCTVTGLQGGSGDQARIDITGFIDHRYYAGSNDRFFISPTASVEIVDGDFIEQTRMGEGRMATATVPIFPPDLVLENESTPVPWWVIFLAILAAVIILAVIVGILWGLGFFKRRKHEELKQKREDLQNLENNGSGPGIDAGSKENIVGDGTNL